MLFDLQGKRRRVVQATYLALAVLMGGGLVLFGIGGDVSGGLFDAFSDNRGSSGSDDTVQKRIERNEGRVAEGGRGREAALKELVRDYYSQATNQVPTGALEFPDEARDELEEAAAAYQRYLKVADGRPDPATANFALQIYDVGALNDPAEAKEAASVFAAAEDDWQSYVRVVQYATLAGDTRTADLAGQKALGLATKGERKEVQALVKQAKQPPAASPSGGAAPGG